VSGAEICKSVIWLKTSIVADPWDSAGTESMPRAA
jgi:hypothetical protein